MLLCYITDRKQLSADGKSLHLLLERIAIATRAGVDVIQIREKDLIGRGLVELGIEASKILREHNSADASKPRTRLLINSRVDVAITCGADGVQLPADDMSAADARSVFPTSGLDHPVIGVSCHTIREVGLAEGQGADFVLFGPVFEKAGMSVQPNGIGLLSQACHPRIKPGIPIVAVGGITQDNAAECLHAGASGIAAIRFFQTGNVVEKVSRLRRLAA